MRKSGLLARSLRMGGGVLVALLLPLLIGLVIDSRFSTRPWGTLAALLIGSLVAMYIVVRLTFDFYRSIDDARPPGVPPSYATTSVKEDENE